MISNTQAPLFLTVFILYISLMIVIGYFASRKSAAGTGFLTGGGHLPIFLTVCTAAATLIGSGAAMGRAGQGFSVGLGCFGYAICGFVTMLILAFCFTGARDKNFLTVGQEMQYYYGGDKNVRRIAAVLTFLCEVCYVASHMTGGAKYLQFITGFDPTLCKAITLLAFTVYVWLGGYLAVVYTDAIQLMIILVGFVGIFFKVFPLVGSWSTIADTYIAAGQPEALVPFGATDGKTFMSGIAILVAAVLGELGVSTHRHRIYTSKSAAAAKKSFIITAFVSLAFVFIPVVLGMCARVIATGSGDIDILMQNTDFAFPYLCINVLGGAAGILLMVAGLSATLSSGDSDSMAGVTILIKDVMPSVFGRIVDEKDVKKVSRVALVVTLVAAFVLTLFANGFISFLSNVLGALTPALAVAMFAGRFCKKVTPVAGSACMVIGTLFGVCYIVIAPLKAYLSSTFGGAAIPVALLSIVVIVVVSIFTKRPEISEQEILDIVLAERKYEETPVD